MVNARTSLEGGCHPNTCRVRGCAGAFPAPPPTRRSALAESVQSLISTSGRCKSDLTHVSIISRRTFESFRYETDQAISTRNLLRTSFSIAIRHPLSVILLVDKLPVRSTSHLARALVCRVQGSLFERILRLSLYASNLVWPSCRISRNVDRCSKGQSSLGSFRLMRYFFARRRSDLRSSSLTMAVVRLRVFSSFSASKMREFTVKEFLNVIYPPLDWR